MVIGLISLENIAQFPANSVLKITWTNDNIEFIKLEDEPKIHEFPDGEKSIFIRRASPSTGTILYSWLMEYQLSIIKSIVLASDEVKDIPFA